MAISQTIRAWAVVFLALLTLSSAAGSVLAPCWLLAKFQTSLIEQSFPPSRKDAQSCCCPKWESGIAGIGSHFKSAQKLARRAGAAIMKSDLMGMSEPAPAICRGFESIRSAQKNATEQVKVWLYVRFGHAVLNRKIPGPLIGQFTTHPPRQAEIERANSGRDDIRRHGQVRVGIGVRCDFEPFQKVVFIPVHAGSPCDECLVIKAPSFKRERGRSLYNKHASPVQPGQILKIGLASSLAYEYQRALFWMNHLL